ncbi:MAG: hypothetical protein IPN95_23555 [Bacteroidetes bacterium]|nr:hypothetical protein [Bacteroidota bacterium]
MEHPNHRMILRVLDALGSLANSVVLVGGAVVELYCDRTLSHQEIRPTRDVDIVMHAITFGELDAFANELFRNGFYQSMEDDVVCRFRLDEVIVDVLSTNAIGWAPSNRWLALGYPRAELKEAYGRQFRILEFPYFLAAKFAAFIDRGMKDPRLSHDLEDIVTMLDSRSDWPELVLSAEDEVREYLTGRFFSILNDIRLQDAMIGNLPYSDQMSRFSRIIAGARRVCSVEK